MLIGLLKFKSNKFQFKWKQKKLMSVENNFIWTRMVRRGSVQSWNTAIHI